MKRILDPLDERILAELSANARIAHAELGARVNLSRNAVRQRIERLERDGAIQGYTLRLGESKRPTSLISALFFVYRHDRMRGEEVLNALRDIPDVVGCEVLSGEYDLLVRVNAASAERVHRIWKDIAAMPGVENTVTSFVLSEVF